MPRWRWLRLASNLAVSNILGYGTIKLTESNSHPNFVIPSAAAARLKAILEKKGVGERGEDTNMAQFGKPPIIND